MRRIIMNENQLRRLVGRLIVEALGQEHEFYHATFQGYKDQLVKGIDPKRAHGYGQGAGFYVFLDKDEAIKHAKIISSENSPFRKGEESPEDKKGMIVVIREKLTLDDFDVDYEALSPLFIDFINENFEEISELLEDHGDKYLKRLDKNIKFSGKHVFNGENYITSPSYDSSGKDGEWFKRAKNYSNSTPVVTNNAKQGPIGESSQGGTQQSHLYLPQILSLPSKRQRSADHGDPKEAARMGWVANMMKKYKPLLFVKFEEQVFSNLDKLSSSHRALKFNGDRIIRPARMEDLDGKIIWKR